MRGREESVKHLEEKSSSSTLEAAFERSMNIHGPVSAASSAGSDAGSAASKGSVEVLVGTP